MMERTPRVVRFPFSKLPAPGAFSALVDGSLDLVHVEGVLTEVETAALLDRLPEDGQVVHPPGRGHEDVRVFGRMIAPTGVEPQGPSFDDYRRANVALARALGALFDDARSRILRVIAAIGGTDSAIPDGYGFGSVRRMPDGCGAPLHRDAYPQTPAYRQLREWCDLSVQISWYLQLSVPREGGFLRVYPELVGSDVPRDSDGRVDIDQLERRAVMHTHSPAVGDLVLHAGSARWHRVTPAVGPLARHTLGGFCAWSAARDRILSWA